MSASRKEQNKRKVQGVTQSQAAALHIHQEEEETAKTKQAQIDHMYQKQFAYSIKLTYHNCYLVQCGRKRNT